VWLILIYEGYLAKKADAIPTFGDISLAKNPAAFIVIA
jgi:hypothetical protein